MRLGRRRRLVALSAVALMVAACVSDSVGSFNSAVTLGTSTSSSTTELKPTSTSSTSTSSTSTSTTLAIREFDPRVIGSYVFAPVDWGIVAGSAESGIHLVHLIVEVRPIEDQAEAVDEQIDEISGQLVWNETVIDLCTVGNRHDGDPRLDTDEYQENEFMWIGDILWSDEWCTDWSPNFGLMRNAFEEFGLPEQGCISFIANGLTHDLCEPLYELPATYQWNWTD